MIKYYKNVKKIEISLSMYEVGEVKIPADAVCMELDEAVAGVINKMSYPDILLEEVIPEEEVIFENVEEIEELEEFPEVKTPLKRKSLK